MENTKLRFWQGLVALAVDIVLAIFVAAPIQIALKGLGLVITELIIAAIAVAALLIFRGSWRELFPTAKVKGRYIAGSIVLWIGTFFLVMAVSNLLLMLFPEMAEVSSALTDFFTGESVLMAVLVMPLMAGVCEELLHRGFMLSSFGRVKSDWLKVLIFGLLFGLFHLDPYRFLPTAILGAMLTLVMLRTKNIIVPMAIHFFHDFVTIGISYGLAQTMSSEAISEAMEVSAETRLSSVIALLIVAIIPLIIGLLLLRKERPKTPSDRVLGA